MKVYYHDNVDADQRLEHDSGETVSEKRLAELGVFAKSFKGPDAQRQIDQLAQDRHYKNRDIITVSKATIGQNSDEIYKEKLGIFYKEHLHEDEEIRYIIEGEGFFDVRNDEDRWIRTKLEPGDLLILPAGIYHRFTPTKTDYVKALRLFKDEPKWTALNRPADDNRYRKEYLSSIVAAK